jgi:hypothetical protein
MCGKNSASARIQLQFPRYAQGRSLVQLSALLSRVKVETVLGECQVETTELQCMRFDISDTLGDCKPDCLLRSFLRLLTSSEALTRALCKFILKNESGEE